MYIFPENIKREKGWRWVYCKAYGTKVGATGFCEWRDLQTGNLTRCCLITWTNQCIWCSQLQQPSTEPYHGPPHTIIIFSNHDALHSHNFLLLCVISITISSGVPSNNGLFPPLLISKWWEWILYSQSPLQSSAIRQNNAILFDCRGMQRGLGFNF